VPAPHDDLRREPLDARIANAIEQLHVLARTVAEAHSLAYDRPGARWPEPLSKPDQQRAARNRGAHPDLRTTSDPHRLPVAWRRDGSISTAASHPWALRYQQAAAALARADRNLAELLHTADRPWPAMATDHIDAGVTPAPTFVARIALRCSSGLTTVEDLANELSPSARIVVTQALEGIDYAWRKIPDMTPRRSPKACRNPKKRPQCEGLPISHQTEQLCKSCHQADRDARRKRSNDTPRQESA
jgi:hypothetical protein